MKTVKNLVAGVVAAALVTTPVLAQTERASAPVEQAEDGFGGGLSFLPLIGIVATIVGIVVLASKDDEDPISP